ncbi:hypothetical protein [Actinoplanes ianthinogenes]|uniref:hypothetical protein n=1 Tax=Actinoplanes ianthinogenes TaxID=122358 RepID=UPI001E5FFCED|nr:hypothetical protein [Actinoplanes ianthinogenes]
MSTIHATAKPFRSKVGRRLRSLTIGELVNIPLQPWIWFRVIDLPLTTVNLIGFSAFAALLATGAAYWSMKLRQLRRKQPRLPARRYFAAARILLPIATAAALIVCAVSVARLPGASSWPGLAFAVFAALEYVNYFHVQLMHDNRADLRRLFTSGFRRSHLARDLNSRSNPPLGTR